MIEIYKDINSNFDFNGDIALTPSRCVLKLELNGICDIEGEHPFDDEGRWKHIKGGAIIACPTPYSDKQLFRIYHAPPNMTGVKFYARHIFFDLDDDTLLDVRPTNLNCEDALNKILEGTRYKGHSNISNINTSHYIRKSRLQAICSDDDNSLVNKYGGERLYDNFDVYIQDRIGSDKGVRAEFGYNLMEIEGGPNFDGVITSIIPVAYDGLMLEGSAPWVDSPLINKYDHVIRRTVDMGDIKVKGSEADKDGYNTIEEARQAMVDRCNELFKGGIDKPTVNYSVDMLDLSTTTAYENYIQLEKVSIGDTVTCIHGDLDIDLKARCISMEWDCVTETPINLELGDYITNFFNEQADIQSRVDNIINSNGAVKGESIEGVINALNTRFKALRDIAQPQPVRAMLFEDRIKGSNTFGCMVFGTMGFEIANTFKPGTEEWDFKTFGTGAGFVADCIVAGVLKSVLIQNLDGSFQVDLSKPGGALFRNDGKDAIKIENNQVKFYNWAVAGDYIGSIGSLYDSTNKVAVLSLWNDLDSIITLSYAQPNTNLKGNYFELDKYGLRNKKPITFYEDVEFKGDVLMNLSKDFFASRVFGSPDIGDGNPKNSIIRMGSPVAFDEGITNDLTVRGNVYANNIPKSLNADENEVIKEDYRLITAAEYNQLKSEVEELKKKVI